MRACTEQWCYIGKRKLERAISLYQKTFPGGKDDVFSINWRPYYLNYNPSPHSIDKLELAKTKLSGMTPEKQTAMTQRVNQIGLSVGIIFKSGGKIGQTRDAHRLVHLSQTSSSSSPAIRDALVDKLFEAYHELEKDISARDVLRGAAVDAGLDAPQVDQWLDSSSGADSVDDEARKIKETAASSGVPTFVIQGVHRVEGAQDPTEFMEIFAKVKEGEGTT